MDLVSALRRLQMTQSHLAARLHSTVAVGAKYSASYKNYALSSGRAVSFFHDVPLDFNPHTKTATMVVEVPRFSNAKFEISTSEPGNPIVQDVKDGNVRFVKNLFPYKGYIHNYGAFPQTYEDPSVAGVEGHYGDGDPLDVCEVGLAVLKTGERKTVKILGALALLDDGELDWKVIVVDVSDPLARLNSVSELRSECPGLLEATHEWFRKYKMPDGKPENRLALGGRFIGAEETVGIIQECHEAWKQLVANGREGVSTRRAGQFTVEGTEEAAASIPLAIDKWFFV